MSFEAQKFSMLVKPKLFFVGDHVLLPFLRILCQIQGYENLVLYSKRFKVLTVRIRSLIFVYGVR